MKCMRFMVLIALFVATLTVAASSDYWLVRDSQLRSKPIFNSGGSRIDQGTAVSVIKSDGVWRKVSAPGGKTGWLPSYELRQSAGVVTQKKDGSVLGMLIRSTSRLFGRSASEDVEQGVVATIGVRGLSEEELKQSKPNYQRVDQIKAWASSAPKARKAASNAGLKAVKVAEIQGASS